MHRKALIIHDQTLFWDGINGILKVSPQQKAFKGHNINGDHQTMTLITVITLDASPEEITTTNMKTCMLQLVKQNKSFKYDIPL
jgi:hypothetical protein